MPAPVLYKTAAATVIAPQIIYRIVDAVFIPLDTNNKDYRDYLAWIAQGNTPGAYTGG